MRIGAGKSCDKYIDMINDIAVKIKEKIKGRITVYVEEDGCDDEEDRNEKVDRSNCLFLRVFDLLCGGQFNIPPPAVKVE